MSGTHNCVLQGGTSLICFRSLLLRLKASDDDLKMAGGGRVAKVVDAWNLGHPDHGWRVI